MREGGSCQAFKRYWRYSGSIVFAESSLPFLVGIARFWDWQGSYDSYVSSAFGICAFACADPFGMQECNLLLGEDGFLHDANDCAEELLRYSSG